jgi:hypothetical protein
LQNLLEFLDSTEDRFAAMGALGYDTGVVKMQIEHSETLRLM